MASPQRKVISLAERRELMLRRSELATLTKLPNWDVLNAVVEEEVDAIKRVVMGKAMTTGLSLEEQAYHRGRIVGLRAAISIPRHALRKELTESSPKEVAASE